MKLTLKDVIVIALTAILSFPVIYMLVLFASGTARIEFSRPILPENKTNELKLVKQTARKDSIAVSQSQTFIAIEQQKADLAKKQKDLAEQQERVQLVQQELEKTRTDLMAERQRMEKTVSQSDDLDKKRIKQLAKVYGAMRADEAARILETLDDDLCINILSNMGDDRQKAKILSALTGDKATRVSNKIGSSSKNSNR